MKAETVVTLLFLVLIAGILLVMRVVAFKLDHFMPELAAEMSLWSFGVSFTNTTQGLIWLRRLGSGTPLPEPPTAAGTYSFSSALAAPVVGFLGLYLTQVMLMLTSLGLWVVVLALHSRLCVPSCPPPTTASLCGVYALTGISVAVAYFSLEIK